MAVLDDYPEFTEYFLRQFVVTFSIQREVRMIYIITVIVFVSNWVYRRKILKMF